MSDPAVPDIQVRIKQRTKVTSPSKRRTREEIMEELKRAKQQGELNMNDKYIEKLLQLQGFDIVIIVDDSGSMQLPSDYQPNPGVTQSRYEELYNCIKKISKIANVMDDDGIDIIFLNFGVWKNVKDNEIDDIFRAQVLQPDLPSLNKRGWGGTPLCEVYRQFIKMYYPSTYDYARNHQLIPTRNGTKSCGIRSQTVHTGGDHEKPILLILATDGEPTDGRPEDLKHIMEVLHPRRLYKSIVACTGEANVIKFLQSLDTMERTDVTDDFNSEKRVIDEIQRRWDPSYNFSYDDYLAKILLGSIDPDIDQLNDVESSVKRGLHLATPAAAGGGGSSRKRRKRKLRKNRKTRKTRKQ
jgi:hypothetical protein